jgi:hypothetical protein
MLASALAGDTMPLFNDANKPNKSFTDRRSNESSANSLATERRQFGNSHVGLSPDAMELAKAIDDYKLRNRRRFITCEEMLSVIRSLGYSKPKSAVPAAF